MHSRAGNCRHLRPFSVDCVQFPFLHRHLLDRWVYQVLSATPLLKSSKVFSKGFVIRRLTNFDQVKLSSFSMSE